MIYLHTLFEETKSNIVSTDDHIKYFFPMLYSNLKGNIEMIFPIIASLDNEDTSYLNSKTSGLSSEIYLNNITDPNAWTIPGITKPIYAQFIAVPIVNSGIIIYSIMNLLKNKIDYKLVNNNLQFTTNLNCLMWQTRGLKTYLQDKELRYAIWLHELGHWVKFENGKLILLFAPFTAIPIINFIAIIIIIALLRSNEKNADMFVKEVGYGKQLATALETIGYKNIDNATFLIQFSKYIEIMFTKIHDVVDTWLPVTDHPSFKSRISNLREDYITIHGHNVLYESLLQNTIYPLLKRIIEPIDKLISDNIHIFNKSLK